MKTKPSGIPKALVQLAVLTAAGRMKQLADPKLKRTLRYIPRIKVAETILEVHLFAGFPSAIEGFIALGPMLSSGRKTHHVARATRALWRKRGEMFCRTVYGRNYGKLMRNMHSLNPDLAEWIIEDGYGKVLSRPGLSPVDRELIAISVLAYGGWIRQLHSHILGARNLGASPAAIRSTLRHAVRYIPAGRKRAIFRVLNRTLAGFVDRERT